MKNVLILLVALLIFVGGFFTYSMYQLIPQGHGSKASYSFKKSKDELKSKIDSLIQADALIKRKKLNKPPDDNYYNEDPYFTVCIDSINFCFRYFGDSLNWSKNSTSEIFIASIRTVGSIKYSKEEKLKIVEDKFVKKLGVEYQYEKGD
jgi:hypothetical protein